MKAPTWFLLLETVREIAQDGEIHSQTLVKKTKLPPKDASAWLCKLCRWGYLERAGQSELGGKSVRYELTKYGLNVKAPKERHFKKKKGD
jgi:DNA-binding IclR family transcriptional regulator